MAQVGAAALALALGVAGLMGAAAAQTPPAPPARQEAARRRAGAEGGAGCRSSGRRAQSAWVKLCEKATAVGKDKDGKEEKKELNICLTHHERLDGNTGMVLVSAAVRQVDGQDKQHFMVMVPLGMLIAAGHARLHLPQGPVGAWCRRTRRSTRPSSKASSSATRCAIRPAARPRWRRPRS